MINFTNLKRGITTLGVSITLFVSCIGIYGRVCYSQETGTETASVSDLNACVGVMIIERGVYKKGKKVYFVPNREGVSRAEVILEYGKAAAFFPEIENGALTGNTESVETLIVNNDLFEKATLDSAVMINGFYMDIESEMAVITTISYRGLNEQ